MSKNIIVYDLETTGLNKKRDKIIEAYFYNIVNETCLHLLINPECDIPSDTIAIHGLTNLDLKNKPIFKNTYQEIMDFVGNDCYIISHNNINFDKPFLLSEIKRLCLNKPKNWKFIDTLHIARILYPELKNHKQDTLRELNGLKTDGSHRANKDVKDLAIIYKNMIEKLNLTNIKDVYKLSKNYIYHKMPFGKYKDVKMRDIPNDYIRWLLGSGILNKKDNEVLFKSFIKYGKIKKIKNKR